METAGGRSIDLDARLMASTAVPSETPGAVSKPMVAAGNWAT